MRLPDKYAGKSGKCPCGEVIQIPLPSINIDEQLPSLDESVRVRHRHPMRKILFCIAGITVCIVGIASLSMMIRTSSGYRINRALRDLRSEIASERISAATILGELQPPKAFYALLEALKDEDPEVRRQALIALGGLGNREAVDDVTKLLKDRNKDVQQTAVQVLGKIGDSYAIRLLIRYLDDSDSQVRTLAGEALVGFGTDSIRPLTNCLTVKQSRKRQLAAKLLQRLDHCPSDPEARINYLIALSDWDALNQLGVDCPLHLRAQLNAEDPQVYALARKMLKAQQTAETLPVQATESPKKNTRIIAKSKSLNSPPKVDLDPKTDQFLKLAQSQDWEGLKRHGDHATRVLAGLLSRNDVDSALLDDAASALAHMGPPAIQPLTKHLTHPDERVRQLAEKILGQMGEIAVPSLKRCLQQSHPEILRRQFRPTSRAYMNDQANIRTHASQSLLQIGTIEALMACLQYGDIAVQRVAMQALSRLSDPRIPKLLVASLNHGDHVIRRIAQDALQREDPKVIDALTESLKPDRVSPGERSVHSRRGRRGREVPHLGQSESFKRRSAAEQLSDLNSPQTIPGLISILGDEDSEVQRHAANGLLRLGSAAVAALTDCLKNGNQRAREKACEILGKSRDHAVIPSLVIPSLVVSLKDTRDEVRSAAAQALFMLDYEPTTPEEKVLYCLANQNDAVIEQLGGKALEPLINCLAEENPSLACRAIQALARLEDKRAIKPLLACLESKEAAIRRAAVQSMQNLADQRAVSPLLVCLEDQSSSVIRATLEVLSGSLLTRLCTADKPARISAILVLKALEGTGNSEPRVNVRNNLSEHDRSNLTEILETLVQCTPTHDLWIPYVDPKGRFVCRRPLEWEIVETKDDPHSTVRFKCPAAEIGIIARATGRHILDEPDREELTSTQQARVRKAQTMGQQGQLLGVDWMTLHGIKMLKTEFDFTSPDSFWMRQMKFKLDGYDHKITLTVRAKDRQAKYQTLFDEFLRNYCTPSKEK